MGAGHDGVPRRSRSPAPLPWRRRSAAARLGIRRASAAMTASISAGRSRSRSAPTTASSGTATPRTYTARGNALRSQGTSELHADTLVASYIGGSSQIEHVVAEGTVRRS